MINMEFVYEDLGEGFPVVLIHAFPLSKSMWKPNIDSILNSNYRVICLDLPGFGNNKIASDELTMEGIANYISDLLNKLKIKKAIFCGLSMGGYVTFNLYRLFPELVSGLILCDTNCEDEDSSKQQLRYDLIKEIEAKGSQALIDNILPNLISGFTKLNNKDLVKKLEKDFLEASSVSAIAALKAMAIRKDHTYLLQEINIPTLLIFGEQDKVTNLETANLMNERIQNSTLKVIKNAGHYSNLENPDEFNIAVTSFLNSFK